MKSPSTRGMGRKKTATGFRRRRRNGYWQPATGKRGKTSDLVRTVERSQARAAKTQRGFSSAEIFELFAEETAYRAPLATQVRGGGYQRKVLDWKLFRLTYGSKEQRKRWFEANRAHLRVYRREYWRRPENAERMRKRQALKRIAEKADPVRYAKRRASWAAFRARRKAAGGGAR